LHPLCLVGGLALALGGSVTPVLAHEQRQAGQFQLTVGWAEEPAYTDLLNAVDVTVRDASGAPVSDLGDGLTVRVVTGGLVSQPLALHPVAGVAGEYRSAVLPTRPGTYTFRFSGSIHGQTVDESFTSSGGTFDDVRDAGTVQFPAQDPTRAEIAQGLDRSQRRADRQVAALEADLAATRRELLVAAVVAAAALLAALAALAVLLPPRLRARRQRLEREVRTTDASSSPA
jgi:hypothetical protein